MGPDPLKICRMGRDPSPKIHILLFRTVVKDERLVSKIEGKTNFSRRLKQFDLTDPTSLILQQIYELTSSLSDSAVVNIAAEG